MRHRLLIFQLSPAVERVNPLWHYEMSVKGVKVVEGAEGGIPIH